MRIDRTPATNAEPSPGSSVGRTGAPDTAAPVSYSVERSAHEAAEALVAIFNDPNFPRRPCFKYPVDEPETLWLSMEELLPTEPAAEFAEWVQMLRRNGFIR